MTQPICRLEDGTPLWLTGAVRLPEETLSDTERRQLGIKEADR